MSTDALNGAKTAKFLDAAITDGLEVAITNFGTDIDEREIEAIRELTEIELIALRDLNKKIAAGSTEGMADWTCGAVC